MQFELRKFKSYAKLSDETLAYSAELWVDGKKAADCQNEGKGGPDRIYYSDRAIEKAITDWVAEQPAREPAADDPEWLRSMGPRKLDVEGFIQELIAAEEAKAWLKRRTKSAVLFRIEGDKADAFRSIKFKPGERHVTEAFVRNRYGAQIVELH